jgi:hypothetical protein
MGRIAIGFGLALIALGAGAYLGSGRSSLTALIPAFFGAAILLCGVIALKRAWARPAMMLAALISAAGLAGALSRIVPGLIKGQPLTLDLKTGSQLAMAALTTLLVIIAASWLIRRPRGGQSPR